MSQAYHWPFPPVMQSFPDALEFPWCPETPDKFEKSSYLQNQTPPQKDTLPPRVPQMPVFSGEKSGSLGAPPGAPPVDHMAQQILQEKPKGLHLTPTRTQFQKSAPLDMPTVPTHHLYQMTEVEAEDDDDHDDDGPSTPVHRPKGTPVDDNWGVPPPLPGTPPPRADMDSSHIGALAETPIAATPKRTNYWVAETPSPERSYMRQPSAFTQPFPNFFRQANLMQAQMQTQFPSQFPALPAVVYEQI